MQVWEPGLAAVRVVNPLKTLLPSWMRSHWAARDAAGNSAVLEYLDGELRVHDNGAVGVLTNDPDWNWQVTHLNQFASLSPDWPGANAAIEVGTEVGTVPAPVGHGLNLGGLPGDFSPPSRFVRMFFLRSYAHLNRPPATRRDALALAQATPTKGKFRVLQSASLIERGDHGFGRSPRQHSRDSGPLANEESPLRANRTFRG